MADWIPIENNVPRKDGIYMVRAKIRIDQGFIEREFKAEYKEIGGGERQWYDLGDKHSDTQIPLEKVTHWKPNE